MAGCFQKTDFGLPDLQDGLFIHRLVFVGSSGFMALVHGTACGLDHFGMARHKIGVGMA